MQEIIGDIDECRNKKSASALLEIKKMAKKMTRVMMHHQPTFMSVNLVAAEVAVKAVKQFMDKVNKKFEGKSISTSTSLKFAKARKLDVPRAVILKEEDLDNIEPMSDPLRTELETGKFTILPGPDTSGVAIALFTANSHNPKEVSHRTTLQGVIYQLHAALQSIEPQVPQRVRHSTISSFRNYSTGIDDKTSNRNMELLLNKISTEMNYLSKGIDKLERQGEKLDGRLGKVEEKVERQGEKLDGRLGKVEEKVTELNAKMDGLSEQGEKNFTQILFFNRTIVLTAMGSITLAGSFLVWTFRTIFDSISFEPNHINKPKLNDKGMKPSIQPNRNGNIETIVETSKDIEN